jgi:hypothetical protein
MGNGTSSPIGGAGQCGQASFRGPSVRRYDPARYREGNLR